MKIKEGTRCAAFGAIGRCRGKSVLGTLFCKKHMHDFIRASFGKMGAILLLSGEVIQASDVTVFNPGDHIEIGGRSNKIAAIYPRERP
jgi:hypothetical protein